MKKIVATLIAVVIMAVLMVSCSGPTTSTSAAPNATSSQTQKKVLKVGMELAYPPFETKDNAGNPTGISVDLAKDFAASMGMEAEIQNISWDGLIPSLQTGKVDVVISSMTITEKRKAQVDFSDPYAKAYLALLISKNSNVQKAEELNASNRVIAVKQNNTNDTYARDHFPKAKINAFDSENACVTEVSQGKADAFIYDQLTIYRNSVQFAGTTRALYIPSQDAESWGMAFKKGSELSAKANEFLKKYTADGGFDSLSEKYLKSEKETFNKMGFAFFFADKSGKWPSTSN